MTVESNNKKMSASAFDTDKLAERVRLAIGGRSLSSFAEEVGVSKSYVSKIVNGKIPSENPPSRKILSKVAEKTQNGVTLSDLYECCGYETDGLDATKWPPLASAVQKHYNKALPMAAVSVLMNGLALNGVGTEMSIKTASSYFEITTSESAETYIGIPAFCQEQNGFKLMYTEVLSALLVLSQKQAVFYVLTDNKEFYRELVDRIKPPDDMRLAKVYTEDHLDIKDESKIGCNHVEWNPISVVASPESITAK